MISTARMAHSRRLLPVRCRNTASRSGSWTLTDRMLAPADGRAVVEPSFYRIPRAINPAGGLISSARDLLRYARFHLGDGTVPGGGPRLLTRESLLAMRSHPGPGGVLGVELDGFGVTWMLRRTAEGPRIVQHGGDLPG